MTGWESAESFYSYLKQTGLLKDAAFAERMQQLFNREVADRTREIADRTPKDAKLGIIMGATILAWAEFLIPRDELPEADRARIHALTEPSPSPGYRYVVECERIEDSPAILANALISGFDTGLSIPEPERARLHAATRSKDVTPVLWGEPVDAVARELANNFAAGATLPEPERARIHALTRKVTMTDEDLVAILKTYLPEIVPMDVRVLQDLRDRYEERGKYAPARKDENMPEDEDTGTPVDPMPECDPGKCSDSGQQTDPGISPDLGGGPGPAPQPADDEGDDQGSEN